MTKKEAKEKKELKGTLDFLIKAFEAMRDIKKYEADVAIRAIKKLIKEGNNEPESRTTDC